MLEDELREMFAARVRTPPAVADPVRPAIRRGRRAVRRRQTAVGAATVVAFAAMLGASGAGPGVGGQFGAKPPTTAAGVVTFESLFGGSGEAAPDPEPAGLPNLKLTVDLRVGNELWTSDGRRVDLSSDGQVNRVVSVPAGWVYSDAGTVRMISRAGEKVPLTPVKAPFAVSNDGSRLATVDNAELKVASITAAGLVPVARSAVPDGTLPTGFYGQRVVLRRTGDGFDHWSASSTSTAYTETWNDKLLAVFGSRSSNGLGLIKIDGVMCLVELSARNGGLLQNAVLGCGDVLDHAASTGVESPDGRWLAVSSATGVHLIDVVQSRKVAQANAARVGPVVAASCEAGPDAPTMWADDTTVLAVTNAAGIIACRVDGTRLSVTMPTGAGADWELVPLFAPGK